MTIRWMLVFALMASALPLFATYTPYLVSGIYMRELAMGGSPITVHGQASSDSIFSVATAMLCVASPRFFVRPICPLPLERTSAGGAFELQHLSVSQRVFLDQVVPYAPSRTAIITAEAMGLAARSAIHRDDDHQPERYTGRCSQADRWLKISSLSDQLAVSLRDISLHLEIAILRTILIQNTVSNGLALLDAVDAFLSYLTPPRVARFDHVIVLSTAATADSARRVLREINHGLFVISTISKALEQSRPRAEHGPWQVFEASCSATDSNLDDLASVAKELLSLQDVLRNEFEVVIGDNVTSRDVPLYPFEAVRATIGANTRVLRQQLNVLRLKRRPERG